MSEKDAQKQMSETQFPKNKCPKRCPKTNAWNSISQKQMSKKMPKTQMSKKMHKNKFCSLAPESEIIVNHRKS